MCFVFVLKSIIKYFNSIEQAFRIGTKKNVDYTQFSGFLLIHLFFRGCSSETVRKHNETK